MLVFTRRPGESFVIDGNITVKVLAAYRGVIRIGIEAPKEISVHRSEIQEKINRQAKD